MMDWTDPISAVDGETHKDLIGRVEDALRFVQAAGLNVFNEVTPLEEAQEPGTTKPF